MRRGMRHGEQRGVGETWRMFVAVYPPEDVARAMVGALEGLRLPPHRVVPTEQVHMTMQFIGNVDIKDLDEVEESVRRSGAGIGPCEVEAVRLMTLPRGRLSRLVAVETTAPAGLMEAQRRLATRLARNPRERAGDRFLPHITICRFVNESAVRVDEAWTCRPFVVDRLCLVKSDLGPSGAVHTTVSEIMLAG